MAMETEMRVKVEFESNGIALSGALVTPDTVLTASHCLDPLALEDGTGPIVSLRYLVSFSSDVAPLASGDTDQFPADAIDISTRELHPDYDLGAFSGINGLGDFHDIGLAFLSAPVTDVTPVLIVTSGEAPQVQSGAAVEMVGWGWQQPDPPPPAGTVGVKICAPSFINEIGAHEMQIGDDDTLPRKCHGDSGGPTYMQVDTSASRRVRVVGVTSHTYDATECQKGSVDTRVDVRLDWIDATMRARCADGTRVWCDTEGIIQPSGGGQPPEPEPGCKCAGARGAAPITTALLPLLLWWRRSRR